MRWAAAGRAEAASSRSDATAGSPPRSGCAPACAGPARTTAWSAARPSPARMNTQPTARRSIHQTLARMAKVRIAPMRDEKDAATNAHVRCTPPCGGPWAFTVVVRPRLPARTGNYPGPGRRERQRPPATPRRRRPGTANTRTTGDGDHDPARTSGTGRTAGVRRDGQDDTGRVGELARHEGGERRTRPGHAAAGEHRARRPPGAAGCP